MRLTGVFRVEILSDVSQIPPRLEKNSDNKTANIYVKKHRFNTGVTMTPIKCLKRQKFAYHMFACKISCYHYTMSEVDDIVISNLHAYAS